MHQNFDKINNANNPILSLKLTIIIKFFIVEMV